MRSAARSSATFVLGARSESGGRDGLELDERAEALDLVEVDAHVLPQQQPAALVDDDGVPSAASSAARSAAGSARGRAGRRSSRAGLVGAARRR